MRITGRSLWRATWLGGELLLIGLRFFLLYAITLGRPTLRQRAVCLHWACRRALRVFVDRVEVVGPRPASGLLVSNHLSYLDIPLLGALAPTVFVSKVEVKRGPVFGWFAALGGTVFVRRERRGEVGEIAKQIRQLLKDGHLVVLFPEGTSSGGDTVLPFKSSLLEPVVGQTHDVHAGCISYSLVDGVVSGDVSYWGDMTLAPHITKLLGKSNVQARINFTDIRQPATDRKELAKQLHAVVSGLHPKVRD
jgi:1-acyl-sn-glycerol-3-phosphate acyltransferase